MNLNLNSFLKLFSFRYITLVNLAIFACPDCFPPSFINKRSQKALGIISQINSILSNVRFGSFHFDIAFVLIDALCVNSILVNSEVWHNVQQKHVLSLEQSDLNLMKKILNSHSSEAYYLDLAKYPLRFTFSNRRLMYLWHLLHRDTSELI